MKLPTPNHNLNYFKDIFYLEYQNKSIKKENKEYYLIYFNSNRIIMQILNCNSLLPILLLFQPFLNPNNRVWKLQMGWLPWMNSWKNSSPKNTKEAIASPRTDYCKYDNQILTLFTSSLYLAALVSTFRASHVTRNRGCRASIICGSISFFSGAIMKPLLRTSQCLSSAFYSLFAFSILLFWYFKWYILKIIKFMIRSW